MSTLPINGYGIYTANQEENSFFLASIERKT
jgi:hypothetical protein